MKLCPAPQPISLIDRPPAIESNKRNAFHFFPSRSSPFKVLAFDDLDDSSPPPSNKGLPGRDREKIHSQRMASQASVIGRLTLLYASFLWLGGAFDSSQNGKLIMRLPPVPCDRALWLTALKKSKRLVPPPLNGWRCHFQGALFLRWKNDGFSSTYCFPACTSLISKVKNIKKIKDWTRKKALHR